MVSFRSAIICGSSVSRCNTKFVSGFIDFSKQRSARALTCEKSYSTRYYSVTETNVAAMTETMATEEESREFASVYHDLVRDLTETDQYADIPEVTKHFAKVLEYNVNTGNKKRGHLVVNAYKTLETPNCITPEKVRLACILGWCTEMALDSFLMVDDIMDSSETRRRLPCWYRNEGIGLTAINDSAMVMAGLYIIIRKYFSDLSVYIPILSLFNDATLESAFGQTLDVASTTNRKPKIEPFTTKKYVSMATYKASPIFFQLPISLALYLTNNHDGEIHKDVQRISRQLGNFYQIENDILDCFGNPQVKIGNDICEGKCTWLVVEALKQSTPAQRKLLLENYGNFNVKCAQTVRNLYDEMRLLDSYFVYKEKSFQAICSHIQQTTNGRLQKLFLRVLEKTYGWKCYY